MSSGSYPAQGGPPGSAPPLGGAAVLDLSEIRGTDAGRVGPKIARLGQLARDGWRLPDGYAVTVDAMAGWLPPDVREELARLVAGGRTAGADELAAVRDLIEAQPPPEWLAQAVAAAHERLAARTGHGAGLRVAVRSSAVAEDATSASFAGQFDTYLGVTGVPDVLHHVCKCWASGLSAHALAYRRRADGSAGDMAGGSAGNMADSPPGVIVRYLCQQAAAIEDAAGGAPQDVEWAIARGQPFPDSVFILQHRPVTTLDNPRPATPPAARDPGPHPATPQPATAPARKPAFDPVQYALRNVFRVPGA